VGTDDLRQLLTATTAGGAKMVLVGDEHQFAPVKARGGTFAQLCDDLPWTQRLTGAVSRSRRSYRHLRPCGLLPHSVLKTLRFRRRSAFQTIEPTPHSV
jgi:hypothetical protein